ncbi:MAG: hypothetical protein KDC18_08405 [Alphaproteobacteria bacterium]|nr:hypothetical protein [Alphaproteobacteria bacterium]
MALPDGDTVAIGAQGPALLATHDAGRLEAVLWQLIDEGRADDAMAVLAYVARHRPAEAPALAVTGLRIVTDLNDQARARTLVAAIASESGTPPDAILAAVQQSGLPADFWTDASVPVAAAEEDVAGLEPAAGRLPAAGRPQGAEGPASDADRAPAAVAANAPVYGGYGGGGGFGGGLPPGLTIGGGSGGRPSVPPGPPPGIPDPPTGGGMSR